METGTGLLLGAFGYLRGLYGMIKDSDAHVRFTFLTGVSASSCRFSSSLTTS